MDFNYCQQQKVTMWLQVSFSVEADSKEEADEIVQKIGTKDIFNEEVEVISSDCQFDTATIISPEDNNGSPTIKTFDDKNNVIAVNSTTSENVKQINILGDFTAPKLKEPIDSINIMNKYIVSLDNLVIHKELSEESVAYTANIICNGYNLGECTNLGKGGITCLNINNSKLEEINNELDKVTMNVYNNKNNYPIKVTLDGLCDWIAYTKSL